MIPMQRGLVPILLLIMVVSIRMRQWIIVGQWQSLIQSLIIHILLMAMVVSTRMMAWTTRPWLNPIPWLIMNMNTRTRMWKIILS
jgi:hypothetical protein